MHKSRYFALILLSAVATVLVVASACGGDDDEAGPQTSPLSTYLTQLSAVISLGNIQVEGMETRYPTAFEDVQVTKDYYAEYVNNYTKFSGAARDVAPPAAASDAHNEYVAATEAIGEINQQRLGELAAAATIEDVNSIFALNSDYQSAVERQKAACRALADMAKAEDVNVPGLTACNKLHPGS